MADKYRHKRSRDLSLLVPWIMAGAAVLLAFYYSINRFFDHDEFFAIHTAWKIWRGEKMYTGFLQLHHPLLHFLLTPVIGIFGEGVNSIFASRIIIFIVFLLILAATYGLSSRVFGKETGIISVALLATTFHFFHKAIEVRPDVPLTLFGLLSILYLLDFIETRSRKSLILGTVFLGVAYLFLQKAIILIFLMECLFLYCAFKKRIYLKEILLHAAVLALVAAPLYLYVFFSGSFERYIMFSWVIHARLLDHFPPFPLLLASLKLNFALWGFYALALVFFMKTRMQKMFAFISLGLLASIFLARAPNPQYLLPSLPLVAGASAYAIRSFFGQKRSMVAIAVVISTILPLYTLARNARNTNDRQLRKIEFVLKATGPEDYVYDGNVLFNLFRKDLDYFWYCGKPSVGVLATYQSMTGYRYDVPVLIKRFRPRVISIGYMNYLSDQWISGHYVRSGEFEDLYVRVPEKRNGAGLGQSPDFMAGGSLRGD